MRAGCYSVSSMNQSLSALAFSIFISLSFFIPKFISRRIYPGQPKHAFAYILNTILLKESVMKAVVYGNRTDCGTG